VILYVVFFLQKLSHHFPFKPPPSIRLAKNSCIVSTLGGAALACPTTAGVNLGAEAPLDAATAIIKD
jgi:hypothetical protein